MPDERQPWEVAGDAEESGAPVNPTNEPITEEERRNPTAQVDESGSSDEREEDTGEPEGAPDDAQGEDAEDPDAGPLDDREPPPERTHEEEGEVGAGSQYAAEDARDEEHAEPRGPAGAA